jgi:hypothetical protein
MTDITELAAACANRIFDRMELCRGSAILKEDIAREVESTLREAIKGALFPGVFVDESDGITMDPAYVNEFFAETSRQYHESNALLRHNSRAKHTLAPGHTVSVDPSENTRHEAEKPAVKPMIENTPLDQSWLWRAAGQARDPVFQAWVDREDLEAKRRAERQAAQLDGNQDWKPFHGFDQAVIGEARRSFPMATFCFDVRKLSHVGWIENGDGTVTENLVLDVGIHPIHARAMHLRSGKIIARFKD